jgi:peptidoglycan/xylan/chitin deacetylase (PgdA/CDA1 family)
MVLRERLFFWGTVIIAVYALLPWVLTRVFGFGVFRGSVGKVRPHAALTFDDGPDPEFTPKLLDLLAKHQVKATFFILGSKAEQHKEIVQRIHQEGHLIGIHNYSHFMNWLLAPWVLRRKHVERSADIIESITGTRPAFYRPPWGVMSVFDLLSLKSYKIVLWSVMGKDWRSRIARSKLYAILTERVTDGSVVLLHDSGETIGADSDAPAHMLKALDEALVELHGKGLKFVRVDEMMNSSVSGRLSAAKQILVTLWMFWERLFLTLFRVKPINSANPLLKLRITEYRGKHPITLSDGEEIKKGDQVAELHLDNYTLFRLGTDAKNAVQLATLLIRRTQTLLPELVKLLETDPEYANVKGLYGITIVHRGTKQLGFTVQDLPDGMFTALTRIYLRILMYIVHPSGKDRLKLKSELLEPKIVAISINALRNRYIA